MTVQLLVIRCSAPLGQSALEERMEVRQTINALKRSNLVGEEKSFDHVSEKKTPRQAACRSDEIKPETQLTTLPSPLTELASSEPLSFSVD